jgi:hypothetical protein
MIMISGRNNQYLVISYFYRNENLPQPGPTINQILHVTSCTRYFSKSRLNATFQMVINGTNPGLWSVFHIEAFGRGNILARYVQLLDAPKL